jgi:hypothetical protein
MVRNDKLKDNIIKNNYLKQARDARMNIDPETTFYQDFVFCISLKNDTEINIEVAFATVALMAEIDRGKLMNIGLTKEELNTAKD